MKREGRPVPPELRELSQAADAVIAQARIAISASAMTDLLGALRGLRDRLETFDAAKAKLEDEG